MSAGTYADLIAESADTLRAAGISDARREARHLLAVAGGPSGAALITAEQALVPGAVHTRFAELLNRRAGHEPLQHIEGTCGFFGLTLACDRRALVPRPDSETVVEAALARIPEGGDVRIADLGTGSGCILLAILTNRPRATGVGVEADMEAADLAEQNAAQLALSARAGIVRQSWADWRDWEDMDLVVSNPPYIARAEIDTLAPEVREHDPRAALDGGVDGLDAYREIAALGAASMRRRAWLVLEIGHDQGQNVPALLADRGFSDISVAKDFGGNDRVVCARR